MYRKNHIFNKLHYNFNFGAGGLGDNIARLPVIKYIIDNHPHIIIHFWVQDYFVELAKKSLGKKDNLIIKSHTEGKTKYKDFYYARNPDHRESITNIATHMTDHCFYTVAHRGVTNEYKNYLKFDPIDISYLNLPSKYIVVTTGFTSKTREWVPESIDGVVDFILKQGYTPVFIGRSETHSGLNQIIKGNFKADYSKGINLIDKTNLFEAHAIMANSKCVVGLDNGLLHLACMSDATVVFGFTSVTPEHRLPYRYNKLGWNCYSVVPPESLGCRFCQSNMIFALEHSFTDCFYKDFECTKQLSSNLFIEQIKVALEPKTPQEKAEIVPQTIQNTQRINKKLRELGVSLDKRTD